MFRNGQWILFPGDIPGAQKSKDGLIVGIYCAAGVNALGAKRPAEIHVVSKGKGETIAKLDPEAITGIQALTDKADLPKDRPVDPAWMPQP